MSTWKLTKIRNFNFLHLLWPLPGTWKFPKIRQFNFLQFLWQKVHDNNKKSDASIFFNFHDPGYMKTNKNQTIQFSSIFMTPGTWKFSKIRQFNFLQFLWPRVHENSQKSDNSIFFNFHDWLHENPQKSDASIFFNFHDPGDMKIHKNQTSFFINPEFTKISRFNFLQFSWPR